MANQATVARIRILILVLVIFGGIAVLLWAINKRTGRDELTVTLSRNQNEPTATPPVPSPTTATEPSPQASPTPTVAVVSPSPEASAPIGDFPDTVGFVGKLNLIVPVAGVRPDQLLDTFSDARSEGRSHDAIDIPAPLGTPVVAATDGEIIRLFQSEKGGITIYQFTPDKKLVLYYAHLQGYADGLAPGKSVRQGEVIGYVGDTGNAGPGNFHLHFSIWIVTDPKRNWEGTNINPYPLLRK